MEHNVSLGLVWLTTSEFLALFGSSLRSRSYPIILVKSLGLPKDGYISGGYIFENHQVNLTNNNDLGQCSLYVYDNKAV